MNWKVYPMSEGLAKTAGGLAQKWIGLGIKGPGMAFLSILIVGAIQMVSGFVGFAAKASRDPAHTKNLIPDLRSISWAICFGFFATLMPVIGIVTFEMGADLGVRTLIVVSSIVPGAILGRTVFGDPLGTRQWAGIVVFLAAMWAMLDFPGSFSLAGWVWLTFIIMLCGAMNEVLTRKSAVKLDSWVNNFWVGGSTVCWTTLGVIIFGMTGGLTAPLSSMFIFGSAVFGGITVAMIAFKLLAYKVGGEDATINLKKIIMQGSYLLSVTIAGIVVFGEPLTWGKVVGVFLFFVAFAVTDKDTWTFFAPAPKPVAT